MKIEWAKDSDAEAIRTLLAGDGLQFIGGNWTGLGQTWLVARDKTGVRACIAYHRGRPFARLDFLSIDPEIKGLSKVRLVGSIIEAAFAVAAMHGSSFMTGLVSYDLPEFAEFLGKRGGKQCNEGWLFVAPLGEVIERRSEIHGRRQDDDDDDGNANRRRERIH